MSRYSGQEDVVFGVTLAGRGAEIAGIEAMVGPFINTLPARVQVHPQASVQQWLADLQAQQSEVRQYEYSPLVQVQGWSELPGGTGLFESLLVFENYPLESGQQMGESRLRVEQVRTQQQTNYALTLVALPGEHLELQWIFKRERFEERSVQRLGAQMEEILWAMAREPERQVGQIEWWLQEERARVVEEWNETRMEYAREVGVHERFAQWAQRRPEALALWAADGQWSYGQWSSRPINWRATCASRG